MSDNLLQSIFTNMSTPTSKRRKNNKRSDSKTLSPRVENVQESPVQNMMMNPMFASLFSSLMQQMGGIPDDYIEVEDLKEKIVQKVLKKLGIDPSKLESMCNNGKGNDILQSVDNLEDTKSHDFLIVHTYQPGNYGYIVYKGNYEGAKRHALSCLGREHGMYDSLPNEEDYCVRRFPVYTLQTDKVRIEVLPHASWVSLEEESTD